MTFRHGLSTALKRPSRAQFLTNGIPVTPVRFFKHKATKHDNRAPSKSEGGFSKTALSPLSLKVRHLMRQTPHSLAAVVSLPKFDQAASSRPSSKTQPLPSEIAGLLVSSFNTVSLAPRPYISFNIKTPSATYQSLRLSSHFTVTGLADVKAAEAFAAPNARPVKGLEGVKDPGREDEEDGSEENWRDAPDQDRMDVSAGEWKDWIGKEGQVLSEHGGTWWMRCKWRSGLSQRVGDHMIIVGEVLQVGDGRERQEGGGEEGQELEKVISKDGQRALVYVQGTYKWV